MFCLWRSAGLGFWVSKVKSLCLQSCCIIWNTHSSTTGVHSRTGKPTNVINRFNGIFCLIYKLQAKSEKSQFQQKHRGSFAEEPLPPWLSNHNTIREMKLFWWQRWLLTISQAPNASLAFTLFLLSPSSVNSGQEQSRSCQHWSHPCCRGSEHNQWAANEHWELCRAWATKGTTQVLQQPRKTLQHTFRSYLSYRNGSPGLQLHGFLQCPSIIQNSGLQSALCAKGRRCKVGFLTGKWKIISQKIIS